MRLGRQDGNTRDAHGELHGGCGGLRSVSNSASHNHGIGSRVANRIGPHDGPRPEVLGGNCARISMLTPSGLHFGEGPMAAFNRDELSGPVSFPFRANRFQPLVRRAANLDGLRGESGRGFPGSLPG